MAWRWLEDRAIADVAFRAEGWSLEELFSSSVDALMSAMVEDLSSIRPRETREAGLDAGTIDMLLFDLLQEVIYRKDAEGLLLRVSSIRVTPEASGGSLAAVLSGERIDPSRHALLSDVKAVTLYRYSVEPYAGGWAAEIVLDV